MNPTSPALCPSLSPRAGPSFYTQGLLDRRTFESELPGPEVSSEKQPGPQRGSSERRGREAGGNRDVGFFH